MTKTKVLSYGSCQFPTLSLLVERHNIIEQFEKKNLYTIKLTLKDAKAKGRSKAFVFKLKRDHFEE